MRLRNRPKGLLRWLLRLPIWLYRHNMGWLLGNRFIMLQHTGRKSGLARYAVVEVVDYDREHGIYSIASGWGRKSDWYRNILKTPDVWVTTYKGQKRAHAVPLSAEDGARALQSYATRHSAAFRALTRFLLAGEEELENIDLVEVATMMPLVRIHLEKTSR
jgi:deazaflavin-dependent oxidoreductase (nitroreductase family)